MGPFENITNELGIAEILNWLKLAALVVAILAAAGGVAWHFLR